MKLHRISVKNVRNHESFVCDFSDTTTLIYGKNGAGKTAILEAISIAYRGKSFRGVDRDIMRNGQQWYRIDIEDDSGFSRQITYDARKDRPTKHFTIDDKTYGRLPQKEKYPIVLFTPDDLRMIGGSPARRREYLDYVISQYDTQYGAKQRRYERALLQRNRLLKQPGATAEQLFSWNVILAETGAYIINARIDFVAELDKQLATQYQQIAEINDDVHAVYSHNTVTPQGLLVQYETSSQRDLVVGSTSIGPHRHDMFISLRDNPAATTASRGEIRTIVLAMKFIEAELIYEKRMIVPLILLDDVFGELDGRRQGRLINTFNDSQVFITSTEKYSTDRTIFLDGDNL